MTMQNMSSFTNPAHTIILLRILYTKDLTKNITTFMIFIISLYPATPQPIEHPLTPCDFKTWRIFCRF